MKIVHLSAECYPVAKVGGLADVVGALPKYLNEIGQEAAVIMPFYDVKYHQHNTVEVVYEDQISMGGRTLDFKVFSSGNGKLGFDLYFIDIPELLFKENVYSSDDTERFIAFQIASLSFLKQQKELPDIIHCHDHHTGLVPFMMQYCNDFEILRDIPSVLTIHNAQYQGWLGHDRVYLIPDFDPVHTGLLDWDHCINPLAAAIKCAWKVTTVSPSYMEELKREANGLESLLSHEHEKCTGILNGIDTQVWNPSTDAYLKKNYKASSHVSGKKANKKWLCNKYGLDEQLPLFVFIGRLVHEKGSDLFPEVFEKVLGKNNLSILLLGSGNPDTERDLASLKESNIANYNHHIGYDEELSHIIYAGADFLLMPSRVEPCGLNQMYSLTYGTIPVVRNTGGLKDTIVDVENGGYGFKHENATVSEMAQVIDRAIVFYDDTAAFRKVRKRIMNIDNSWENSAKEYLDLYNLLKK